MSKLFANSGDSDQTPPSVASDLGLHGLPITLLRVSRLQRVKGIGSDIFLCSIVCFYYIVREHAHKQHLQLVVGGLKQICSHLSNRC